MTTSYTVTNTATFTRTHAIHIASKVITDLKRMQRFYGEPSDKWIEDFCVEAVELLKGGYLHKVTYGFKRGGVWVEPTLLYTARDLGSGPDDDPGKVRPGASIVGASFGSFLEYNQAWVQLTPAQREAVEKALPFRRTTSTEPSASGYWAPDLTYSAGGRALSRETLRSYR